MTIVDVIVRATLVVAAALVASAVLRGSSAAVRHAVLATSCYLALLIVPLTLAVPKWTIALPLPAVRQTLSADVSRTDHAQHALQSRVQPDAVVDATDPAASGPGPGARLLRAAGIASITGSALAFGWLLVGLGRLVRTTHRAAPITTGHWPRLSEEVAGALGITTDIRLVEVPLSSAPATWGIRTPHVLLPKGASAWTEARARIVLRHELSHISRGDWLAQMAAQVLAAAFWFNPLFWLASARLRRESERACDDAVLASGTTAADYAAHLVDIARQCRAGALAELPALAIAHPAGLEGRITAMLDPRLDRRPVSRRRAVAIATVLVLLAAPAVGLRLSAQPRPTVLTGSVYDITGAVLPQVGLTLRDSQGATFETSTDASGRFEFTQVVAGTYTIEAKLAGFKPLTHEFALKDARDWDRAITLQVGTLQETISVRERRTATAKPTTRTNAEPVRIGGNIRVPRKLRDVRPVYPPAMRDAGQEGVVPIEALIGVDGRVASVRVVSAQVHPDFAVAAVDAVRQWQFSPTLLNGTAVEVVMTVTVNFNLSEG